MYFYEIKDVPGQVQDQWKNGNEIEGEKEHVLRYPAAMHGKQY